MPGWLIPLLVSLVLNVVAYLLAPKPKTPKPDAARDLEDPTAEAGRPIPVVFGTITVKGGNILWFGEKSIKVKKIRV
jgi:predicted phage tail protein